jgi:hypothetical protein
MRNPWKLTSFALAAALAFGSHAIDAVDAAPQPNMRSALGHLEAAHAELVRATADKGGHRVKALALTKDAIAQVKKGIAFDNKH